MPSPEVMGELWKFVSESKDWKPFWFGGNMGNLWKFTSHDGRPFWERHETTIEEDRFPIVFLTGDILRSYVKRDIGTVMFEHTFTDTTCFHSADELAQFCQEQGHV